MPKLTSIKAALDEAFDALLLKIPGYCQESLDGIELVLRVLLWCGMYDSKRHLRSQHGKNQTVGAD